MRNSRLINIRHISIKEYGFLFFVLTAFNVLSIWIYRLLENSGLLETSKYLALGLIIAYIIFSALLVTVGVIVTRYKTWILPIKKLKMAAREITKGDFSVRVTSLRKDGRRNIVDVLFDDFNTMTEELSNANINMQNLVTEKTEKVIKLQNAILKTMFDLTEFRDNITGGHTERTQNGVRILLDEIIKNGLFTDTIKDWDKYLVLMSTQLHDIGKIAIKDQILRKPGKLTDDEFDEMKKHTDLGFDIIKRIKVNLGESDILKQAKIFALTHHEKWDGSGYPKGLKGYEIPLEGRIMAIADVYDALVSERPYKKAIPHEEAVKIILEGKHIQFDPLLIDLFVGVSERFR